MRIMPTALFLSNELAGPEPKEASEVYKMSALTHAHARCKAACFIYSKLIADILNTKDDKDKVISQSLKWSKEYLNTETDDAIKLEIKVYHRLWDVSTFKEATEDGIKSSGYVVDTLEAAIWCFLTTDSYKDCVLKAVNLGDDTDTVGAVTGGIAGAYYGMEGIPREWLEVIPKREWIEGLVDGMVK